MTSSVFQFFYSFFRLIWQFFNSWNIPGTNLTPAEFLIFLVVAWFLIRLIRTLFDVDFSDSSGNGSSGKGS